MARIVVAGVSEVSRTQLSRLLASSGFEVFRMCASGSELRRTLSECGDGIAVITGALRDGLPDDLAADFGGSFVFLLIGRPDVLRLSDSPQVFKLAYPCAGNAVIGALEMLTQVHSMRLPHRQGEDKELVERAKKMLMEKYGIDEPEAHRRIQIHAMSHSMKMKEYAALLLQGGNDDA